MVDGQQLMQRARVIKTEDEITLLNTACMMVDAAYDELYRAMKPGMTREPVRGPRVEGAVRPRLGARRGRQRDLGRALQPAPPRLRRPELRPGDPAYFDILHTYIGYRTCYYRTFAIGSASRAQVDAYTRCRALPRRRDLADPARRDDRRRGVGLAEGRGVRLPERGGRLRPAVRARHRALDLGEADLQPPRLARAPRGDRGGDGVRARDLLARERRLVRRRASRRNSSSRRRAARSSRASRPRSCSSPASATTRSAASSRRSARRSRT